MSLVTPDQSRQARRELGLSQADVEAGTGLKRQYLSEFEAGTSNRFTRSHLRKLVDFYTEKIEAARAAGDEITVTFGEGEADKPVVAIEAAKVKRVAFMVADEVSGDTLVAVRATMAENDRKLADLLTREAKRDDGFLGSGEFTEESLEAMRGAMSLLACNYLMVRAVSGWPEIGLSASNDNLAGNTVLATILGSVRDQFEAAGLVGKVEAEAAEGGEDEEGAQ